MAKLKAERYSPSSEIASGVDIVFALCRKKTSTTLVLDCLQVTAHEDINLKLHVIVWSIQCYKLMYVSM